MSNAKEILNKINEANHKFKPGDFVFYQSASGREYNCFGKVIEYVGNSRVCVQVLCKASGGSDVEDVCDENGQILAPDYSLKPGEEILQRRIMATEKMLNNLKEVQGQI